MLVRVSPCSLFSLLCGVTGMAPRGVGVVRRLLVLTSLMLVGRFTVMPGSVPVVFRCTPVVFRCLFRHKAHLDDCGAWQNPMPFL